MLWRAEAPDVPERDGGGARTPSEIN